MNIDMLIQDGNNKCKGVIWKCYESTFSSGFDTIGNRKYLKILKRKSCPGCKECGWIYDDFSDFVSNGDISISNCENGKLYELVMHTSQGYYDLYPDIDYLEFREIKGE